MTHHATQRFWQSYATLPQAVQDLADDNFTLLKANPRHPSLHFKQIGRLWSVRIGTRYRALGISGAEPDSVIWFWIGSHSDYDRLIKSIS